MVGLRKFCDNPEGGFPGLVAFPFTCLLRRRLRVASTVYRQTKYGLVGLDLLPASLFFFLQSLYRSRWPVQADLVMGVWLCMLHDILFTPQLLTPLKLLSSALNISMNYARAQSNHPFAERERNLM